jgi:hypothetical protein
MKCVHSSSSFFSRNVGGMLLPMNSEHKSPESLSSFSLAHWSGQLARRLDLSRVATEAAWLNGNNSGNEEKTTNGLTLTGLLMEGVTATIIHFRTDFGRLRRHNSEPLLHDADRSLTRFCCLMPRPAVFGRTSMGNALRFAVVLFLACATSHNLFGQEPGSPQSASDLTNVTTSRAAQKSESTPKQEVSMQDTVSTFKLRVNLVQVHVIVRGDKGKPIGGLSKEDFQLYDNGKLQLITTFGVEDAQSRKERSEAAAKTQVNQEENNEPISRATPDRFIALTFDDIHLLTRDVTPMRNAANGFIDSIGPSDRVGFFTTSEIVTQDFTDNKELLKQALLK